MMGWIYEIRKASEFIIHPRDIKDGHDASRVIIRNLANPGIIDELPLVVKKISSDPFKLVGLFTWRDPDLWDSLYNDKGFFRVIPDLIVHQIKWIYSELHKDEEDFLIVYNDKLNYPNATKSVIH